MQQRAMNLMAQKLDASLALEGQFSAEGLAAMSADSGSLTMELAKSLVENIPFADAERVWEKLSALKPEAANVLAADDANDDDGFLFSSPRQKSRRGNKRGAANGEISRQFSLFL
jgi:hypothetical protein